MFRFTFLSLLMMCSLFSFAQKSLWENASEPDVADRQIVPAEYRTLSVDFDALKTELLEAPPEKAVSVIDSEFLFELPAPDGTNWIFRIVQSSIMAPELQDKFPEIRTFLGQGTGDHRNATLRMDFTPKGFHAQVLAAGESFYIDPYSPGNTDTYICYSREAFYQQNTKTMPECNPQQPGSEIHDQLDHEKEKDGKGKGGPQGLEKTINGTQLRVYDLALACTGEYAQFHGGTTAGALAAMVTSMNRVNGIFERDLSLRMVIIGNNDQIIYLNAGTDPYSNGNGFAMLGQNQNTCDNVIGSANYDIGHVFSTGGGGVASLQSPCSFSSKARGVTGQGSPVGDPFDVDYVAHEMGHQWGGNHTQNNSCNRASSAAFEPGSASTIMGYAGICPPNLQSNSDDHFHNHSFNEMYDFSVNGNGDNCATTNPTGNTPPSVTVPSGGFFIPISTPFELTASGSDPDPDLLTYCWEQYDLGPSTAGGDNDLTNPSGNQPIFRSWSPTTDPTRVFPRLSDLVNNTTVIGELLPTYSRDLTFRCTVRDNRANGGGVVDDQIAFESTASAGPFLVSTPNTAVTWTGNTSQTISWDVANTDAAPVNCSNVDIFLSEDGGFTYPYTLAANVPNDGSEVVTLPNINTTQARVKVKAANNIFFDISDQDFTINSPSCSGTPNIASISPNSGDCSGGASVTLTGTNFCNPVSVSHGGVSATITSSSETEIVYTVPAGTGTVDVEVTSPFGTSTTVQFSYNAPLIASLTPSSLPCEGGALLTLSGLNFCDASSVSVGGSTAAIQSVTANSITATAPAGSGTNVPVVVTTPSGTSNSETIDYQAPLIASITPSSLTCEGGTLLTLSGSNFCNASSVSVGGSTAAIQSVTANSITATAPAGSGTNVPVVVTTPSGTSNSETIDYQAPLIASVTPSLLPCAGGITLTIIGSNFCNATDVTIDGNPATSLVQISSSEVQVTSPAGSGTNVPVVVLTPSGSSAPFAVDYDVCPPSCDPGFYDDNGTCTLCPPGTYCPGDGNSYPCAAGEFSAVSGAESCEPCLAGYYNPNTGSTSCLPCEAGSFSDITGATECTDCPAGTSQGLQAQTSCVDCPAGTFSAVTGSTVCTDCPAGTSQGLPAQTSCLLCPPGTYSDITGATECAECSSGTYQDQFGSIDCIDCPSGTSSDPGATSCEPCSFDVVGSAQSATPGFANGSATVTASGGIPPYSYSWNDSFFQTDATAVGLFPGTYTCVVTDDNDCVATIDVLVPLMVDVPETQINDAYCNTGGYELSDFIAASPVQNADAYRWEFSVQGGSTLPEYTRTGGNKWVRLQWITGIAVGTTYDVRVKASVEGEWGEYGTVCTIATAADVPLTEVRPQYHPTNSQGDNYNLCDFIIAYSVPNATNYRWRFDVDTDPNNGNEIIYTRGSGNTATRLSWVNGLTPATTYEVAVQAAIGATWGDYGNVHSVILAQPPAPVLRASFCNQTYSPTGYVLSTSVCEASYYQFEFEPVGGGPVSTLNSGNYVAFFNNLSPSLSPGDYSVRVRVSQGGVLGEFGAACPITIAVPEGFISDETDPLQSYKSLEDQGEVSFFPNPNDGNSVRITANNLKDESHSVQILVSDMYGKNLKSFGFVAEGQTVSRLILFNQPLSTGIYMIQVVIDGTVQRTERMVISR